MTPAAKLHHYVPQAYLRGFATEKERIVAVPLDTTRSPFTTVVKNVGAQTHFHTITGANSRYLSKTGWLSPSTWRFSLSGDLTPAGPSSTFRRR
jgi:hypothetical protein